METEFEMEQMEIVRKQFNQLSSDSQKMVKLLIEQVSREDKPFKEYVYAFDVLQEQCSSGQEKGVLEITKSLIDDSFWIKTENGMETPVSWIEKRTYIPDENQLKVRFDSDLLLYLCQLKSEFKVV